MDREFFESVATLVREVIPETLDRLETKLASTDLSPEAIKAWSLELPQKSQREALGSFANKWKSLAFSLNREAVLVAIASLRFAEERRTKAEICWSGPTESLQGFRTTSAAYAELVASAKSTVLILTFSIGEVELLRTSLESAVERGVKVTLILEDFDVFGQVSRQDKFELFGPTVLQRACIYIWPTGNRRKSEGKVFGSMHVKCLVIDEGAMLLTSANWSSAAMQDNMELGVVVRDQETVSAVVEHFNQLITASVLVSVP